jgi:hypothetical protein
MPPTPAPTATRFFHVGETKVYYLPAIAAADMTPTRAEINAGTDLSDEIADLAGWTVSGAEIETPDLGSKFNSKIPGRTSVDDSSLTFYADNRGVDVRSVLPRGTAGFIVFCDGGDVAGALADVFPIRVRSVGKVRSVGDDAGRLTVPFSVTREPAEDVALPAAV